MSGSPHLGAQGLHVLVVGGGGREHAIACQLARSPRVERLSVAPGNAGTATLAENVDLDPMDFEGIVAFAREEGVDLVVVGPADPLIGGLVDELRAAGVPTFGPTRAQAELEGSKVFSKAFMRRHGIPTAAFEVFTDREEALRHLRATWRPGGVVIKADGLAEVQSTIVADRLEEAVEAVEALLGGLYGAAGRRILIEERLVGPEVSLLALVDGRTHRLLPSAQDHKRLLDGDEGPNTEGMGAFAPSPLMDAALAERLDREVLIPSVRGLAADGLGFPGLLFVGVLLTEAGPMVLEYNCRFGDPETQVALAALESDLVDVLEACLRGNLANTPLVVDNRHHLCVVAADPAYPHGFTPHLAVTGLDDAEHKRGVRVLHAKTVPGPHGPRSAGGRVVNVVASASTLEGARALAYEALSHVRLGGAPPLFRGDIGRPPARAKASPDVPSPQAPSQAPPQPQGSPQPA